MWALLQLASDYWWLVPLAGAGLVAYKFLGWRGLLGVVTLGLAGGLYTKGKTDERKAIDARLDAQRDQAIKARREVENEISQDSPSDGRDRLAKWVRDDPPGR